MTTGAQSRLRRYIEAGRLLAAELRHTISDLRFEAAGGKIFWAVDSSEVVAYTLPFDEAPADSMSLFDDEQRRSSRIVEQYVLDRILFKTQPLVLLPPYGLELESFAAGLRARAFNIFAHQLLKMDTELDLKDAPQADRILTVARGVERTGRALSESELDLVSTFCRTHAPLLLRLANEEFSAPLERFRHVMRRAQLIDLKTLVSVEPERDDEVFGRWFSRLRKSRRKTQPKSGSRQSSFLDALALATLYRANQKLVPTGRRIQLISRSTHMARAFAEEAELWEAVGGWVFCHPRLFSLFHRPGDDDAVKALEVLEARLSSLNLFLSSAETEAQGVAEGAPDDQASRSLEAALEAVIAAVRACEELAASKILDSGSARPASAVLLRVLQMLSRRDEYVRRVEELLDQLSGTFERENEYLGWLLQIQNGESREIIDNSLSLEAETGTLLVSTLESMPYGLTFYSERLREATIRNGSKWGLSWQEALAFFRSGFATEVAYERLLAMAYILGALGQWSLARSYSEKALDEPNSADPAPRHEGTFFLAFCYRKIVPPLPAAELLPAIQLIDRAIDERRSAQGGDDDPRYLKEKATLMGIVNLRSRRDRDAGGRTSPIYPVSEIRALLERAYSLTEQDSKLRVQVLNNLCYLCIEEVEARPELSDALGRLEEFLCEIPAAQTPASVVDTVVYSRFVLHGEGASTTELDRFIADLSKALGKVQRGDGTTRRVLRGHLVEIEARRAQVALQSG